jgi:hypothetical protein
MWSSQCICWPRKEQRAAPPKPFSGCNASWPPCKPTPNRWRKLDNLAVVRWLARTHAEYLQQLQLIAEIKQLAPQ